MQRCRQAVLDHIFRLKIFQGRMQFAKFSKIFKHGPDNIIRNIIRQIGTGYEGREDTEGFYIMAGRGIGTFRYGGERVIGRLGNKFLFRLGIKIEDPCTAPVSRLGDTGIGHTDRIAVSVNLAIAQRFGLLG